MMWQTLVFFVLCQLALGEHCVGNARLSDPDPAVCDEFTKKLCGDPTGVEKLVCDALDEFCRYIICDINDVTHRLPLLDADSDFYSPLFALRGYAWRGRDCNDNDPNIYPGRKTGDNVVDHNCNGIYGSNASGSYEDLFCKDSGQLGIAILGDSTGAHFGLPIYPLGSPEKWLNAAENEFDSPHCSWSTGWQQDPSKCERSFSGTPPTSIYYKMWQRNRCNFRDYQNVAVNGARSPSIAGFANSTGRNPKTDHPLLTFYSPAANDVCNPHIGSDHMTTPESFYENNLSILRTLDSLSPPGSSVVMVGLFHGEMIYDAMHEVPYPYFQKEGHMPFTYGNFWAIGDSVVTDRSSNKTLNPCWAWLSPEKKWRTLATQRADELDATFPKLIQNEQKNMKNIALYYMPHPDKDVINDWLQKGNEAKHLFEPDDGAHPSQTGSVLWAEAIWNYMETNWPHLIGPINPYNDEIFKMFGDQGGY